MTSGNESIGPVVVGIDGSEPGFLALEHAEREARWRNAPLHVVHSLDVTPAVLHLANNQAIRTRELAETDREEVWKRANELLEGSEVDVTTVNLDGNPGQALIAYCGEVDASLLVVGPRGRGRVVDALLGSTAQRVVKDAPGPVLIIKG
jgi:nucleotide-binding universal stress UspA family protein